MSPPADQQPQLTEQQSRTWLGKRLKVIEWQDASAPASDDGDQFEYFVDRPERSKATSSTPGDYIHADTLEAASKWAAGGFTALLTLLLFFGVKDGVLDQALRVNPLASLAVILFLGCGLLAALFAPAVDPRVRLKLWAALAAVGTMIVIAALFFPNVRPLTDSDDDSWAPWWVEASLTVGAALVALAAAFAIPIFIGLIRENSNRQAKQSEAAGQPKVEEGRSSGGTERRRLLVYIAFAVVLEILAVGYLFRDAISLQTILAAAVFLLFTACIAWAFVVDASFAAAAGIIILGVVATSLGLYGAAKLSVESKLLAVTPKVTAALATEDDQPVVRIRAEASRLSGQHLRIWIDGTPRLDMGQPPDAPVSDVDGVGEDPVHLWTSILQPDALDSVDWELDVPILRERWEMLFVHHCIVNAEGSEDECSEDGETTVLAMNNPQRGMELTGHIVAKSASSLQVTLRGIGVAPGIRIVAEVCRVNRDGQGSHLASATLAPDVNGQLTWSPEVPAGTIGDVLLLRYKECRPGLICPEEMAELARYTLP
ncbi:hypothetical protein [Geodermatophilus sp. SYSU D00766]